MADTGNTTFEPRGEILEIVSPTYEIPPYTEVMYCYVGSYSGPDVGVTFVRPFQDDLGHHAQLNHITDNGSERPADGTVYECTDSSNGAYATESLFQSTMTQYDGEVHYDLPPGMGFYLPDGQNWVLQYHHTNTSGDTLYVTDRYQLAVIPEEEVEQWASSWLTARRG